MPRILRYGAILTLLTFTLTQFTNCGTYSDQPATGVSGFASVSCDSDCIAQNRDNLKVYVNGLNESGQFFLPANVSAFNLGGECNEGGYPYNTIVWELFHNGVLVRRSDMSGMVSAGNTNTVCVNGRFMVYINLASIPADAINRVGLNVAPAGGARAPHTLAIEVYGQDTFNGLLQKGSVRSRTVVNLIPQ